MAARALDSRGSYQPEDRAAWRAWLAEHHATCPGIWFVYFKKASGKSRVAYADAVEEALCFGWIDSAQRALDDVRAAQYFSPRKPKSGWSKINKERVERLTRDGLITAAGQAKIDAAKRDGSWSVLDAIEALTMPADLEAALATNPAAERRFAAFSASAKKQLFWWIGSAKREATRTGRIERLVASAERGENPLSSTNRAAT